MENHPSQNRKQNSLTVCFQEAVDQRDRGGEAEAGGGRDDGDGGRRRLAQPVQQAG